MKTTLFSFEKMFCFAVGLLLVEPRTAQHSVLVKYRSFYAICGFLLLVSRIGNADQDLDPGGENGPTKIEKSFDEVLKVHF